MSEEKNLPSDAEKDDLNLTAIIKALDSGTPMPDAKDSEVTKGTAGTKGSKNAKAKSASKGSAGAKSGATAKTANAAKGATGTKGASGSARTGAKNTAAKGAAAKGATTKGSSSKGAGTKSAKGAAASKPETSKGSSAAKGAGTASGADFDPNATMDYKQAGLDYPELPFANEDNSDEAALAARDKRNVSTRKPKAAKPVNTPIRRPAEKVQEPVERSSSRSTSAQASHSASIAATPTASAGAMASAPAGSRTSRQPYTTGTAKAAPTSYQPVNTSGPSYKIRGGGAKQKLPIPVFIISALVLAAIGAGIFGYGLNNVMGSLSGGSGGTDFALTTTETRDAIDSRLPLLINYVGTGIEDTTALIAETGQFIYTNDRYQPDSPDATAVGSELVSMPVEMTAEQMDGYYGGSYSAYSVEELAEYFNGAYALDMARGDLGSWNKLKYVNLNATSIEDEMSHLAALQELSGDTVTISNEGVDTRGNFVIQGQKVIATEEGEAILFFKIAACPFKDIYNGASISEASVFITCTVANYDFYTGSDTIS